MSRCIARIVMAGVVGSLTAPLPAQTVMIGPQKDNTLYENPDGLLSNGSGNHFFAGRTGQFANDRRRALIAFDVAAEIPAGATIDSVTLRLNMSRTLVGAQAITVHRISEDWGEAGSHAGGEEGGGALAEPGDATWLHTFYDTDFWSTVGGSFEATASDSQVVTGLGSYEWNGAGLIADVQDWLDNPGDNFGWILIGNEGVANSSKRFDSRENLNPANRPVLIIDYSVPVVGACCDDATATCTEAVTEDDCLNAGARFGGEFSTCDTIDPSCDEPRGACCRSRTGICQNLITEAACTLDGNRYGGDGSDCQTLAPACQPYKNRYISFAVSGGSLVGLRGEAPSTAGVPLRAVRVRLVDLAGFPAFNGEVRWVGPAGMFPESAGSPFMFTAAALQCTPHYDDWSSVSAGGTEFIHAYGAEIVPGSFYEFQIIEDGCDPENEACFSPPVKVRTQKWGDVTAPYFDGTVVQPDISDIALIVTKFGGQLPPLKVRVQLQPNIPIPGNSIDIGDISRCVSAFQGNSYDLAGPAACP